MGEMHFSASEYDSLERMYNATYLDFLARGERIRELEAVLRGIYPAAREILWCALVWNDHNFDWKTLLQHADLAAKQLGFDRLSGDPITAANKWMARIDAALGDSTVDRGGEHG